MEMYGLERFEEFNVTQRWAEHSPHKTLAVPLGLRGKEDLVYLNLHEKAHGPHGLVAGTTGSGKSEIIQSYILSLAVNFHPYDVAFLLIDYKGGRHGESLFRHLPHLLGTITNLDGAQSMRALISINAELKRRQRLFSENNVNHINQYQKLYKSGDVKEPMPHLFLISDEFAELKAEQPDFMKELVSTARIGRSLGIHLILATQKPSGVVNDQIWSNSKFKLALKVADKADSMEMLKTPDAAEITQAGRAYLQVGNNEIYELFQSAWSGADYLPDKEDQQIEDHTIYLVNDLGQYEILSEDLSGLDNADEVKQIPTELEAIIEGIHEVAEATQIDPLPRPWLPPLRERITAAELHPVDFKEAWQGDKQALEPVLGVVDIPSMQAQETLKINLTQEGHMAVFSSPGYGKSTFMQTVALDLARVHNPARVHFYLLDFGTNGLLPLKNLPHVADTMSIDEEEKIVKFTRRMLAEIKRRKKLLSEYSVASLEMYERASGNEEPILFILLDGYEGFKGSKFEAGLEKTITQIAREGAGIGLHLLLSAGRQNALRMNLYSNIKTQIALKLIDDSEPRVIVGRTTLTIDDLPGRGLIKLDEPELFQTALPAAGEDTLQIIDAIQGEVQAMDAHWTGPRPEGIPMVPEVLYFEDFKEKQTVKYALQNNYLPLGIDFEKVEAVALEIEKMKHLTVFSDREEALSLIQKNLLKSIELLPSTKLMIIDSEGNLADYQNQSQTYVSGEQVTQFSEMILGEITRREEANDRSSWVIFIDKLDSFIKTSKIKDEDFKRIYEKGPRVGLHLIICSLYGYMSSYETIPKYVKANGKEAVIGMRKSDQTIYDKPYQANELMLDIDEAYYYVNNSYLKIKCGR
jgi:S-DNA-T family DNA segregation ATPase FtsK/SpoIIIE